MMRSLLYVPADSQRFVAKARERGADVLVLDLEDAIPESRKDAARAALADAVPACRGAGAMVFARINGGTVLEGLDIEAACRAGVDGLFVPKVADAGHVGRIVHQLDTWERGRQRSNPLQLIVAIETADALFEARAIASASERIVGLNCGSEDIARALNARPDPETLRHPKMMVHIAAKAAGVLSLGMMRSVADYKDEPALASAAAEAMQLGFDGATCIHPSAVPILNAAFSHSASELEWARNLLEAADRHAAAGIGAFVFAGRMVDRAAFRRARVVLLGAHDE